MTTSDVQTEFTPLQWREHLFGLPRNRWLSLNNKGFWVTGAGTGYGRCLAVALAAAGAQVFLTGRRKHKLEETLSEMELFGVSPDNCHIVTADITIFSQVEEVCEKVRSLCDTLYGLINNAALPARGDISRPLLEGSIEDWNRIMSTNVTAPWFLTRTIFSHMTKGGASRVLFISSEAGWAFTPGFGPYNVSKAALNNLAASMAAECAMSYPNIDVQMNVLIPCEARTEMNQGSGNSPYKIVGMALALLSHFQGGPNGKVFHWDGRHGSFCYALPYESFII